MIRDFFSFVGRLCLSPLTVQPHVLYAFYDGSVSSASFDFVTFLTLAEMKRVRLGCTELRVVFVIGSRKKKKGKPKDQSGWVPVDEETLWRRQNILIPCAGFFPSCRQFTIVSKEEARLIQFLRVRHVFPESYSVDSPVGCHRSTPIVEASAKGVDIPSVQPSRKALDFIEGWMKSTAAERKVVTLNLRETPYRHLRNSNLGAWAKFARSLDPSKYYPVVIRDTFSALGPLPEGLEGLNVFPEIPWHVDLRAALYEKSYLNLFVNNGPDIFCILNRKTRYLMFKMITEEYHSTSRSFIKENVGLNFGEQWPWANEFQRVVWEGGDDFETLEREFTRMCEKIVCAENILK